MDADGTFGAGQTRVVATAEGRVQGVGYRYFILDTARTLGLTGWVKNEVSGHVTIVAEGEAEAVASLMAMARRGPRSAVVRRLREQFGTSTGEFDSFEVRY